MSIETEFRALLAGHAPLTALVGNRIAQDAVPEGSAFPLVVFAASHDRTLSLSGAFQADQCTLAVQCWAVTGMQAAEVADEVVDAIAAAPVTTDVCVLSRATTFDPDLGADGVLLGVEWWDIP